MERRVFPVHHILLVEDNPGDVRLVRESMVDWASASKLHVVTNGEDAVQFVCQTKAYADAPRPDLIILDLNLPGLSGLDVLTKLKDIPGLRRIPTIMLSSSEAEEDIRSAYELHVNVYLVKARSFAGIIKQFENIEAWLNCARLPFNSDDYKALAS
jgi:chemotaxis family two-component system response regulator Rcp1